MTRAAVIVPVVSAMALLAIGCGARGRAHPTGGAIDLSADTATSRYDLRRDLEATVLEGYQQLTLGNLEAYGDGISRDRDIVLIGISPDSVVVGRDPPGINADRRPFRKTRARFYSKNLNLTLASDRSVGWVYDEMSYRVAHLGREASIPIRVSSVYQREIDRWVLVAEHMGYALPIDDIIELARAGRLVAPAPICKRKKCDHESPGLRRLVESLYRPPPDGGIAATFVSGRALGRAVLVWPDPDQEHHGREVRQAPELAELFGDGATVKLHDYRAFVSPSRKVAWVYANLQVTTGDGELTIGLRASHVLELVRRRTNQYAWKMVQVHVSVPIQIDELRRRVFGESG